MGRRKIEIQPITHERNRSVTFLKRKNGLFKKAYELGVLCSVDVAVIIFEERPGHHVKLYQYGSSDIHDIVQKHLRHDGEKDTRGPSDFSGNANPTKLGDGGEDDDDEDIDDDDLPSRSNKRRLDGKLKPDMVSGGMDYSGHRIPQPPSLSLHPNQSGSGASLPISNDRGMPRGGGGDFKRTSNRLALGHSRSPSDNPNDPNSGPYAYGGSFGGRSSTHYGHPHHGHGGGANHQHHQPHHSGSSGAYQPFFPHPSPPPSFMPLQADFPRGSVSGRGAPGGPGGPGGGAGGFGLGPARSSSGSSTYDNPNIYPNNSLLRGGPPGGGAPSAGGPGGGAGAGNPDLFAAFLDADEQSRAAAAAHSGQGAQGPGSFVGLDWPVHGSTGGGASGPPSGPPSSAVSNPPNPSSAGPDSGPGNNPNWLDFLSGNNPNSSGNPPGPRADSSMSWERGGGPGGNDHRGDIGDMFGGGDRGRTGSGPGGLGGTKRKGEDDGPSGLASPASVNGGRDTKKDVG